VLSHLRQYLRWVAKPLWNSFRDLLPIISIVAVFQLFVFQQPLPNLLQLGAGLLLVVMGLAMFIVGLDMGLFPIGESLAHDFARKGNLAWLVVFAFALGFGTTFAEPALIAIASKAAEQLALVGPLEQQASLAESYAFTLRATVAVSVGFALVLGVLRILFGWPIQYFIIAGYLMVLVLTPFAPENIIGVAYDSGGVTTSTITVPLTTALGVGLAASIKGRSPLLDGFGLIAFASLTPIMFVLAWGILVS
jgi:hypothetical protein